MSTPAHNPLRTIRFCTLAGVEDVRLERGEIVGRFKSELREYYGPKTGMLIEEFVNWGNDAASWLRFVRLHGPLSQDAKHGETFRADVKQFSETQESFRRLWRDKKRDGWQLSCQITFSHLAHKTAFRVPNLYWFLFLDLVIQDPKRLKICKRPDCPTPHFVVHHLGQRYCGSVCAAWAQMKWKSDWWKKHGGPWRESRRQNEQLEDENGKRQSKRRKSK